MKFETLIFNELSKFVQFFCTFMVPFREANEILVHFCDLFQMEKNKMHILLIELQSNQKNTKSMFSQQEMVTFSLAKRSNRLQKFGFNDVTQILGITIKFIGEDKVLLNLLCLNKDLNEILKSEILK